MILILQREVNYNVRSGLISTTAMAGKLTGMMVDLGTATAPALGLAESLANFFQVIYVLYRDCKEARNSNNYIKAKRLGKQPIEKDLLTEAPILGAYYICHANMSDLLNFLTVSFGAKGWKSNVEGMIKNHIHPLQNRAKSLIGSSRLEVTGIANKEIIAMTKREKKAQMEDSDVKIRGLGSGNMYS